MKADIRVFFNKLITYSPAEYCDMIREISQTYDTRHISDQQLKVVKMAARRAAVKVPPQLLALIHQARHKEQQQKLYSASTPEKIQADLYQEIAVALTRAATRLRKSSTRVRTPAPVSASAPTTTITDDDVPF
jgi:hypothetical protein